MGYLLRTVELRCNDDTGFADPLPSLVADAAIHTEAPAGQPAWRRPIVVISDQDRRRWSDLHAAEIARRNGEPFLVLNHRWFEPLAGLERPPLVVVQECSNDPAGDKRGKRTGQVWFKAWLTLFWLTLGRFGGPRCEARVPTEWLRPFTHRQPATCWVTIHGADGEPLPDDLEGRRCALDATPRERKGADPLALLTRRHRRASSATVA